MIAALEVRNDDGPPRGFVRAINAQELLRRP
jgi:hypothetical protein